jgi:hypothetical protein
VLAAKLHLRHALVAKHGPEPPFGGRGIGAHLASPVTQLSGALALVTGGHTPHPPAALRLPPSPDGGRGARHWRSPWACRRHPAPRR